MPGAGVPANAAVPFPLSVKVTPVGSDPASPKEGTGKPDAIIVNDPAAPNINIVLFALVITGADVPIPLAARVCGLLEALSTMVSVAFRGPSTEGVNVTLMVHVAILEIEDPQVLFCEKSLLLAPTNPTLVKLRVLPELLVSVIVWGLLGVPTGWSPNDKLVG